MRGHITSPPLLWVHQRHPTRSMPDCSKNSNDMTHFQQCTCTAHIFNLSAMTGTIILPSASSSSLGGDGIRIIQQSRRSGRLFFSVLLCNRARRRQLRFLGIGYAMIPDAGASGFLLFLLFLFPVTFLFFALAWTESRPNASVNGIIEPRRSCDAGLWTSPCAVQIALLR